MLDTNPIDTRPLPKAADAADWDGFAWLMGIPKDYRQHFIVWLKRSIRSTWWVMVDVERECRRMAELEARALPARGRIQSRTSYAADIAKAGRAFLRALEARDALHDREMAKTVGRYLEMVRAPKRGAPKRDDRFADFIEHLLLITCGLGGSVIFNRKTGKGNVTDLLNELRPLMPEGYIPNVLPMSTIERLAAKARGMMSSTADMPRILAQLGKALCKYSEEDAKERVRSALFHEWELAEELGHMCPGCGEPRVDDAAISRLSQVSGVPVDRLVAWSHEDENSTPDSDFASDVLEAFTGRRVRMLPQA